MLSVLFAVLVAGLQGQLAWQAWDAARQDAVRQARSSVNAIAAATASAMEIAEGVTVNLASLGPTEMLDPRRCVEHTADSRAIFTSYASLSVVDREGRLVCTAYPVPSGAPPDASDRGWFQEVMRTRRFTISEPLMGRISRKHVIALAAPILDAAGTPVGAVAGGLDLTELARIAGKFLTFPGAIATIADSTGRVVTRTVDTEAWAGRLLPAFDYPALARGPEWAVLEGPDLRGERKILSRVDIPAYGWRIYAVLPRDLVLAQGYARARNVALLGVLLAGVSISLVMMAYRRVTRPLDQLAVDILRASRGECVEVSPGAPRETRAVVEALNATLMARAEAEGRYRGFLKAAPFGVYTATVDGRILEVNPALVRMLGHDSAAELMAVSLGDIYRDPEERRRLTTRHLEAAHYVGVEAEWKRRDGATINVLLSGRVIDTVEGRVFEGIVQDVTAHRRVEEMARHQQKVEAVGRLAGGVAHEINNTLTVIAGCADLLRTDAPSATARDEADLILHSVERAASLTRNLLAISRKEVARPESLDPAAAIAQLATTLNRTLPAHIRAELDVSQPVGRIWIDRGHFDQVLLNLVINARDAMPEGGTVFVSCNPTTDPDGGAAPWVRITVRDTGMGMPPDVAERVFEPFFTTKARERGTGLGMAIVLGLVEQAGGRINFESTPGRGTTFTVRFPASYRRRPSDGSAPSAGPCRGVGEDIWLVEDDADLRSLTARVLTDAGYTVDAFSSAEDALAMVEGRSRPVDLLVSDVVLPGMRGPELGRRLVGTRVRRVLYISGYEVDDTTVESGAEVLTKPFGVPALLAAARRALDG